MVLGQDIATAAVVPFSLFLLLNRSRRGGAWRLALLGGFALCAAFAVYECFMLLRVALDEIRVPPLWDFKCFWMYGQVAASHHNVYDPASYQIYHAILNPTGDIEFNTIGADVGLPYPPPGVLLVYPLGLIADLSKAMIVWYIALFGTIAASIVLLWRRFFAAEGAVGLITVAVLVFALSSTGMIVSLAQVQFLALVFLLLFWREQNPWRAGLWLGAAVILRPLFILMAIYLIARRQWRALVGLVLTGVTLTAISIPLLGPGGLATYFLHNPTQRYPGVYFIGTSCLYKLLVKLTHDATYFSLAAHPLFDLIALACICGAAYVCATCVKNQPDACLALLVALGLWLYPSTATHYGVLLLPALCVVWRYRRRFALPPAAVIVFFTLQYLLFDVASGHYTTGLAIALNCVFFAFLAFRRPATQMDFQHSPRPAPFAVGST